jgi:hypothetical protein
MGHLEQFAQQTFADETERITGGAAGWEDPPEIRLEKVQSDGFLVIRKPHLLEHLASPWSEARHFTEILLELKLAGNHLDRIAVERALLRRQARQLQRLEEDDASWLGEEPLWIVAPYLPGWLIEMRQPVCVAPGCYWVDPRWKSFLWIAANELPLVDELIPFLMARSGQALDEFAQWAASRRPLEWVLTMVEHMPMSLPTREELLRRFGKVDDPEVLARRQHIIKVLLESSPETRRELIEQGVQQGIEQGVQQGIEQGVQQGIEQGVQKGVQQGLAEGRLLEARAALRRVLARRLLTPSQGEDARIEGCADLATLERWLDRSVTAVSVADALE